MFGSISQWKGKLKLDLQTVSPGSIQSSRLAIVSLKAPKDEIGHFQLFVATSHNIFAIEVIHDGHFDLKRGL